jgi:hypothetical protein
MSNRRPRFFFTSLAVFMFAFAGCDSKKVSVDVVSEPAQPGATAQKEKEKSRYLLLVQKNITLTSAQ